MELLDEFKKTMQDSKISEFEMSLNFQCSPDIFRMIMDGRKPYTEENELVMFRFILKERKIRSAFQVMEDFYKGYEAQSAEGSQDNVIISKKDVLTIVQRIEREHAKVLGSKPVGGYQPTNSLDTTNPPRQLNLKEGFEIQVYQNELMKDGTAHLFLSPNDFEDYRKKIIAKKDRGATE